jgi:hypothetical protein
MSELFPFTRAELIAEVEREIELRKRVYPRMVEKRQVGRTLSERRIALMRAVLDDLRSVPHDR